MTSTRHVFVPSLICLLWCGLTDSLRAQVTQPDLRQYTERAVGNNIVEINPPYFTYTVDAKGRSYPYSLGGVNSHSFRQSFSGTGLLAIPLEEQFRVTLIRKYRNTPSKLAWWRPRLEQVENEITRMLEAIDSLPFESAFDEIRRHSAHVDAIYHQALLDAGVISPETELPPQCYACSQAYVVSLRTDPPHGRIWYMPAGDWDLYWYRTTIRREANVPVPEWLAVEQDGVELGGKYWFAVSWAGVNRYMNMVHVKSQDPITFRPIN